MNRPLKLLIKIVKIVACVLVGLYLILFAYISINKKSIIRQVTDEMGKKISGKVVIRDVELSFFRHFPKFSVLMSGLTVTDSMFSVHHHPLFTAEHVFAELSVTRLIRKQAPLNGLRIENGSFYLFTDSNGYTNTYLFKPKSDSSSGKKSTTRNELKSIILKDVHFVLDDRKREKLHDYYINSLDMKLDDKDDASFLFNTTAQIEIRSMAFNLPRGSFVKGKKFSGEFDMRYDKQMNQLRFDSIDISLSAHRFNLSGVFDLKKDSPQFTLRAHTRDIRFEEGKTLLPERIAKSLSIVQLDKPFDADVSIIGPLKGGEPLIVASWKVKGTSLQTPFLDFDNAAFTGYYTNEVVKGLPRKDPNSVIEINDFSSDWHGLPLRASNIEIMNLEQPVVTCDLLSEFHLPQLNELIGSNALQLTAGKGAVNLTYKGPIIRNNNTNSFLNGYVSFDNGNVLYAPRDVEMKNVTGRLTFKNSDVVVENLQCNVLNNKIVMDGLGKNLLTLINTEPGKANIDWNIYSPSLNLGSFLYLLKPGKKSATSGKKKSVANAASKIDDVLDQASFHVNLKAGALSYKKFEASNVLADVSLLEEKYLLNKVSMNHAGGNIMLTGSVIRQNKDYQQAKFHAVMNAVNVDKVFNAFENFGQDGITGQNLEGKLSANIDASMMLETSGKVLPSSVASTIDFSLKNGALNNYEPVKKVQNIIFKKRDFDNIRFAELKDRLEVQNRDIKINRMEIESSVLSFFVEGLYSLKGNTDISIQVPLNNLKKRGADYNPENIGVDKKGGRSIFIRGRTGSDGNVNFKIDLFNKFKKTKEGK